MNHGLRSSFRGMSSSRVLNPRLWSRSGAGRVDIKELDLLRRTDPRTALERAETTVETICTSEAHNLLGICGSAYRQLGQYKAAKACFFKALALAPKSETGKVLQRLALVALDQGDFFQAEQFIVIARRIFFEAGDPEGIAGTYIDEGIVLSYREAPKRALRAVDQAKKWDSFLNIGNRLSASHVAAHSYTKLRQFKLAENELQMALELSASLDSSARVKTDWLTGLLEIERRNAGYAIELLSVVAEYFEGNSPCDFLLALADLARAAVLAKNFDLVSHTMRRSLKALAEDPGLSKLPALAVAARDIITLAETGRRIQNAILIKYRKKIERHRHEMALDDSEYQRYPFGS